MISLNETYSVDVRFEDDGYIYELLNGYDEIVAERGAGACFTSTAEGMRSIGNAMLETYLAEQEAIAKRRKPRHLEIHITDDTTDLQAINLVKSVIEQGRKNQSYPPLSRYVYTTGKVTFVTARRKSELTDSFRVWKEK